MSGMKGRKPSAIALDELARTDRIDAKAGRMTVQELLDALLPMPPDAIVRTEGCDCDGDVTAVERCGDEVYLRR